MPVPNLCYNYHMPLHTLIDTYRPVLTKHILAVLDEKKAQCHDLPFYTDTISRLQTFIPKGKLLRGLFVICTAQQYNKDNTVPTTDTLQIAGAMELIQSALLIHDDIMDNDTMRRGEKTIFAQYADQAQTDGFDNAMHYGRSMGLCAGDMAMFFAFEMMSTTQRPDIRQRLLTLFVKEIQMVCAAQMTDMHFGFSPAEPSLQDIRTMYIRKTARYSFSLPFILGAVHSDAPEKDIETLGLLGEYIGLAFQIRDDEIKILGSAEEVGTDIGSDIRENKKTLIRAWLMEQAEDEYKQTLEGLFGKQTLTQQEVAYVQDCLASYDIPETIQKEIDRLTKRAYELIETLQIPDAGKEIMEDIVGYVISRKR